MKEIKITKDNFEEEVLQSKQPVLLEFWAAWCGPCQMIEPVIRSIAEGHPEIKVGRINVDEEGELARAFQIVSIPMIVLMKEGKVIEKLVGYRPKESIEALLF